MKKEEIKYQPWFFAAKGAQRDLIRDAGGIKRVSDFLGVSEALVGFWNNNSDPSLMPQWAVWKLEQDVGKSHVSRAMASNVNHEVVERPHPAAGKGGCLDAVKALLLKEISEVLTACVDADSDGYRSINELRTIRAEFVDVRNAAGQGIDACDAEIAKMAGNLGEDA